MTYTTLKYGAKGEEVKKLQSALNNAGYSLDVDGVFGKNTDSALRDYQKKNALSSDGIAGELTWGSLQQGGYVSSGTAASPQTALQKTEGARPQYSESEDLKALEKQVEDYLAAQPKEYAPTYEAELEQLLTEILQTPDFSYDPSADPLYTQAAGQYARQGRRAMEDAMARAAELTGGYGSSYAQTAGSAAYNGQMEQLTEMIPSLYKLAMDQYLEKNNARIDRASLLADLEQDAYERYRKAMDEYYTGLELLIDRRDTLSKEEYDRYLDALNGWRKDRDYEYEKQMDAAKKSSSGRSSASSRKSSSADTATLKPSGITGESGTKTATAGGSRDKVVKDIITKLTQMKQ